MKTKRVRTERRPEPYDKEESDTQAVILHNVQEAGSLMSPINFFRTDLEKTDRTCLKPCILVKSFVLGSPVHFRLR